MNRKRLIISIIALLVIAGGIWFFTQSPKQKGIQLETALVKRGSISNSVTATGTVEPVTEVQVGTQVSGIVDKLYVDYNDVVKAGQLIAEMDKVNLKAELASAEAQLASSKTEYEYQQKKYARSKVLYEKKLISDSEHETAIYNYEKSLAAYNQSKASMSKVRRNLEYATITSPINGVVINRAVEEGQTVAAGFETPTLFTIAADLTKMQVIADVDEADIGNVHEGQRVSFSVDAYPNDTFEGKVMQVRLGDSESNNSTSSSTVVTYEVVISAENPDLKLKPRLTANITIFTLEKDRVLTIPSKALRFVPDRETLAELGYTITRPNKGERPNGKPSNDKRIVWTKQGQELTPRLVTVGFSSGNLTEIIDGIQEGEELAVNLEAATPVAKPAGGTTERSPFMPGPPGGNRKKGK